MISIITDNMKKQRYYEKQMQNEQSLKSLGIIQSILPPDSPKLPMTLKNRESAAKLLQKNNKFNAKPVIKMKKPSAKVERSLSPSAKKNQQSPPRRKSEYALTLSAIPMVGELTINGLSSKNSNKNSNKVKNIEKNLEKKMKSNQNDQYLQDTLEKFCNSDPKINTDRPTQVDKFSELSQISKQGQLEMINEL